MFKQISDTPGRCWVIWFAASVLLTSLLILPLTPVKAEAEQGNRAERQWLEWHAMPELPDGIGVAGPYVGVSNDALVVAGGANFPTEEGQSIWDAPKVWHDTIWVIQKDKEELAWVGPFHLDRPLAYGGRYRPSLASYASGAMTRTTSTPIASCCVGTRIRNPLNR